LVLPPFVAHNGFIPPKEVVGDMATVDVTFTDGRHVFVSYPDSWQLAERGWLPSTGLALQYDQPRPDGSQFSFAQLIFSYDPTGTGRPLGGAELKFTFGDWAASFVESPEWTDSERDLIPQLLTVTQLANGFITVKTTNPLRHFTTNPEEGFEDRRAEINVGDFITLLSDCDPAVDIPVSNSDSISWCDPDARVHIGVHIRRSMQDSFRQGIDFVLLEP
jgi:hypothetical protein